MSDQLQPEGEVLLQVVLQEVLDRVRKSAEGGAPVASQLVQPMQSGPFEKKISEGKMQLGLVGENTIWDVYL